MRQAPRCHTYVDMFLVGTLTTETPSTNWVVEVIATHVITGDENCATSTEMFHPVKVGWVVK